MTAGAPPPPTKQLGATRTGGERGGGARSRQTSGAHVELAPSNPCTQFIKRQSNPKPTPNQHGTPRALLTASADRSCPGCHGRVGQAPAGRKQGAQGGGRRAARQQPPAADQKHGIYLRAAQPQCQRKSATNLPVTSAGPGKPPHKQLPNHHAKGIHIRRGGGPLALQNFRRLRMQLETVVR